MGGEVQIDTDFVHWFARYGPKEIVGPCPHDCEHASIRNIAWGPDLAHYTLNECHDCGCRAWLAAMPPKARALGWDYAEWLEVKEGEDV